MIAPFPRGHWRMASHDPTHPFIATDFESYIDIAVSFQPGAEAAVTSHTECPFHASTRSAPEGREMAVVVLVPEGVLYQRINLYH